MCVGVQYYISYPSRIQNPQKRAFLEGEMSVLPLFYRSWSFCGRFDIPPRLWNFVMIPGGAIPRSGCVKTSLMVQSQQILVYSTKSRKIHLITSSACHEVLT